MRDEPTKSVDSSQSQGENVVTTYFPRGGRGGLGGRGGGRRGPFGLPAFSDI